MRKVTLNIGTANIPNNHAIIEYCFKYILHPSYVLLSVSLCPEKKGRIQRIMRLIDAEVKFVFEIWRLLQVRIFRLNHLSYVFHLGDLHFLIIGHRISARENLGYVYQYSPKDFTAKLHFSDGRLRPQLAFFVSTACIYPRGYISIRGVEQVLQL